MSKSPIWAVAAPGARKPRFSREQMAQVALAIADEDGFEALSMRRVAEGLGAGRCRELGARRSQSSPTPRVPPTCVTTGRCAR